MPRKTAAQKKAATKKAATNQADVDTVVEDIVEEPTSDERQSPQQVSTLDKGTQEELQKILNKDPESLTEHDTAFLKAREMYLTKEQVTDYLK